MTDQPSPEAKAMTYVTDLGTHTVYEDARARRTELEGKMQQLHESKNRKRTLEALRLDLEMEVTEDLRSREPSMSAAAFDRQIKVEFSNHGPLREVRDDLIATQGEIEWLEYEISLLKIDIEIAVARLHELGGYLQFMAVIKGISEARKRKEVKDPDPWK